MYIYIFVLADSNGLVWVLFLPCRLPSILLGEAKQFLLPLVRVSGFIPATSDVALRPDATLNMATFTLAICLALFPVHCHIRLGKSSVAYTWSNKRPGEKGHRQEIGFLLLSRRAGIWVLPVSQSHDSLNHFLTHSATT